MFAPVAVSLYDNAKFNSLSSVPVPTLYEKILLPTKPGLGIELNKDAIKKYQVA